jgi:hypothetical protein
MIAPGRGYQLAIVISRPLNEFITFITEGETAPILRAFNALPIGHRWDRVAGVPVSKVTPGGN